ncbi:hypothetical protein F4677DRAFT_28468 [Hypoxylon crocopeplum]|nr:hypothetical protein F4677DRAFT_28468 [Hypoxylon crocopeplum]
MDCITSIFTYSTSEPIEDLLQEPNSDEKTKEWRDAKIQELGYVGVTSAIVASLFASAFTWPLVPVDAYATQGCWYCGLILILASVATATQQAVTLHRFRARQDSLVYLRKLLRSRRTIEGRDAKPSKLAMYVWQLPVMSLRLGIYLFILGMLLLIWDAAQVGQGLSLPNLGIAVSFTALLAFSVLNHGISVYHCYVLWGWGGYLDRMPNNGNGAPEQPHNNPEPRNDTAGHEIANMNPINQDRTANGEPAA